MDSSKLTTPCKHPGWLMMPALQYFRSHSPKISCMCRFPLFRVSEMVVLSMAVFSMTYYLLESIKNLSVRNNTTTLYSLFGYQFLLDYPYLNLKVQDLLTIEFVFSAQSYFNLILFVLTGDYASQLSYLVSNSVGIIFKIFITTSSLVCSSTKPPLSDVLQDVGCILLDMFLVANLMCPVFCVYEKCNFMM